MCVEAGGGGVAVVSHPVNKHAHAYPERLTWCCLAGCGSSNGALCGRGGPQRWSSLGESRGSGTLVNIPGEKREKQSPQPDPLVQQCRPSRPRTRGKGRDTREESERRLCDSPTGDSGCDDDSCCSRASCRRRCCSRGESETAGPRRPATAAARSHLVCFPRWSTCSHR